MDDEDLQAQISSLIRNHRRKQRGTVEDSVREEYFAPLSPSKSAGGWKKAPGSLRPRPSAEEYDALYQQDRETARLAKMVKSLQRELAEANRRKNSMKESLIQAKQYIVDTKAQLDATASARAEAEAKATAATQRCADLVRVHDAVAQEKAELERQVDRLTQQNHVLKNECEGASWQTSDMEGKLKELQLREAAAVDRADGLEESVEGLRRGTAAAEAERDALAMRVASLEREVEKALRDRDERAARADALRDELRAAEDAKRALAAEQRLWTQERDMLVDAREEHATEAARATARLDEQLQSWRADERRLQSRLDAAERELATATEANERLAADISALQHELERNSSEFEREREQWYEEREELDMRLAMERRSVADAESRAKEAEAARTELSHLYDQEKLSWEEQRLRLEKDNRAALAQVQDEKRKTKEAQDRVQSKALDAERRMKDEIEVIENEKRTMKTALRAALGDIEALTQANERLTRERALLVESHSEDVGRLMQEKEALVNQVVTSAREDLLSSRALRARSQDEERLSLLSSTTARIRASHHSAYSHSRPGDAV